MRRVGIPLKKKYTPENSHVPKKGNYFNKKLHLPTIHRSSGDMSCFFPGVWLKGAFLFPNYPHCEDPIRPVVMRSDSVYGAALALPQIARTAGWSLEYTSLACHSRLIWDGSGFGMVQYLVNSIGRYTPTLLYMYIDMCTMGYTYRIFSVHVEVRQMIIHSILFACIVFLASWPNT